MNRTVERGLTFFYSLRIRGKIESKTYQRNYISWAGSWGPFEVKISCGECTLTKDVILDTLENELSGIPVKLELREWLSEWWKPIVKGGWHAPIVMVEGKVISQGVAINRGILTQAVIEAYSSNLEIEGNHIFGKESCPHCKRAKGILIRLKYHITIMMLSKAHETYMKCLPV